MCEKKVVSFPSREVRSLSELQRLLSVHTPDEGMRAFIYERLRGRWAEESAHPLNLQIDPEKLAVVKEIEAFFQESTSRWVFELIKAYAELYEAERR